MEECSSGYGPLADYSKHGDGFNVAQFPCKYITYIKFNTNLLCVFYLLINTPTCFGLSWWPSSGSSYVFRHVQIIGQLMWQEFYMYY